MGQKLALSVIIPHYNRPKLLAEALSSVLAQSLQPSEIIIMDDHSRPEAFREILQFNDVAKIHRNSSNLGVPETRNIGVNLASNEWVAFLDDDDLYHPRKLELQNQYLSRNPDCEVLGGPLLHLTPGGESEVWGFREPRRLALRDGLLYTASSMCTMMIRKSAYQGVGGMDRTFRHMNDLEFGIRLLAAGCHMEILPEPLVTYRHGGRAELSLCWANTTRAHFRIVHKHRSLYRQEFGSFGAIQEYARRARFYGRRKGRFVGRSLWAAGSLAQMLVGNHCEAETPKLPSTGRPVQELNIFGHVR